MASNMAEHEKNRPLKVRESIYRSGNSLGMLPKHTNISVVAIGFGNATKTLQTEKQRSA